MSPYVDEALLKDTQQLLLCLLRKVWSIFSAEAQCSRQPGQMAELWGPRVALALLTGSGFIVLNMLRFALPELRRAREAAPEAP